MLNSIKSESRNRIIILDDHPLIMDGVKKLLEDNSAFELTKMVSSLSELMEALAEPFDILILDLNIRGKNSLRWIDEIRSKWPALKILIFSSYNTPTNVKKALEKAVNGYILKDVSQEELIGALEVIARGERYIDPRVLPQKKNIAVNIRPEFEDGFLKKAALTRREKEVMYAIVEGLDNQAIAARMFISLHTVQTHRKRLFKKLGVHSAAELIKFVMSKG